LQPISSYQNLVGVVGQGFRYENLSKSPTRKFLRKSVGLQIKKRLWDLHCQEENLRNRLWFSLPDIHSSNWSYYLSPKFKKSRCGRLLLRK